MKKYSVSTKDVPNDGKIISYFQLVEKIRENFPGHLDLIEWREKYAKSIKNFNCILCIIFIGLLILFVADLPGFSFSQGLVKGI